MPPVKSTTTVTVTNTAAFPLIPEQAQLSQRVLSMH
jgi:hypothetical protein